MQVTLRDSDETRLLARLEALAAQFSAEGDHQQEHPEGWRYKCSAQMKLCTGEHGA